MALIVRSLLYKSSSSVTFGLDAILNGDWEQRGQEFDDAITRHILSENNPPEHPSYEEQIRAKTSREVQEETDTPAPDEGGAIEEARASDLSNLPEADRQEFKDKFDYSFVNKDLKKTVEKVEKLIKGKIKCNINVTK